MHEVDKCRTWPYTVNRLSKLENNNTGRGTSMKLWLVLCTILVLLMTVVIPVVVSMAQDKPAVDASPTSLPDPKSILVGVWEGFQVRSVYGPGPSIVAKAVIRPSADGGLEADFEFVGFAKWKTPVVIEGDKITVKYINKTELTYTLSADGKTLTSLVFMSAPPWKEEKFPTTITLRKK